MEDTWTINFPFPFYSWSVGQKRRVIKKKEMREYDKWKKAMDELIEQGQLFKGDCSITIDHDYITDPSFVSLDVTSDFKVVTQSTGSPSLFLKDINIVDISETDGNE